ncbi:MAG TPA: hypothetical protein VKP88_06465 [Candidatus Paceibacterota bacterium]|nr:hypothetical protein [Candidatus Paceibacterota bacterium]
MKHLTLAALGVFFAVISVTLISATQDNAVTGFVPQPVVITESGSGPIILIEEASAAAR